MRASYVRLSAVFCLVGDDYEPRIEACVSYSYAKGRLVLSVGLSTHKHVFKSELKSD